MFPRPVIEGTLRYKLAQFFLWLLYGRKWHYIAPWRHMGCGTGIVMFHNGKALVAKRSSTIHYHPNKYGVIGGYLNAGHESSIFDSLYREVREEARLSLAAGRVTLANLIHVDSIPNHTTPDQSSHHQLNFQFALVLSAVEVAALEAIDETAELNWLSLDEITALYNANQFAYEHEYHFYKRAFAWLEKQKQK